MSYYGPVPSPQLIRFGYLRIKRHYYLCVEGRVYTCQYRSIPFLDPRSVVNQTNAILTIRELLKFDGGPREPVPMAPLDLDEAMQAWPEYKGTTSYPVLRWLDNTGQNGLANFAQAAWVDYLQLGQPLALDRLYNRYTPWRITNEEQEMEKLL